MIYGVGQLDAGKQFVGKLFLQVIFYPDVEFY